VAHQVRADVAVGAERALGLPRRAGGVEDRGLVVGVERHVGGCGVLGRRSDHILEALEARRGPARGARHHRRPQVEPAEIRRQHRGALRVAEPEDHRPLGVVPHGDRDPVALAQAPVLQHPARQGRHHPVMLGEVHALVLVDEEVQVPVEPAAIEHRPQAGRGVLPDARRYAADLRLDDFEEGAGARERLVDIGDAG